MGKFKYRALSPNGEKIEKVYEANSREEVMDFISSNGYYPLMVKELIESKNLEMKINKKVKLKDLAVFCRQFYTMLNASVPILTCLEILGGQIENEKLKKAIKSVYGEVEKGGILSEAMKKHSDVFPELLVALVASGEASGKLDSIMLRMAIHYEKENKINNKVKSAMIYPIVLSVVAVAAVIFILIYVMPTFKEIFEGSGTTLPWSTSFLLGLSSGIQKNWFFIIIVIVLIGIGFNIFFKTEQGMLISSKLKLKLPILKKLNEMIIVSRFTRTLSTLLSSGLQLVDSIQIVSNVLGNKLAEEALLKIKENIMKGESLYSSMKDSGIFPPMLYSMINIGEETGALDDILNKTADFYDEELESRIQMSVAMIEPLLIIVMGLVIGFIVVSVMLPMFNSYSQLQ